MADALLSPAVGGTMWAATALTVAHCSRRLRLEGDDRLVPLMGVLGAFLFAAQMINFAIPGTGSSGHLGGGLLLAVLLGPHAAFLVMASVLIVQALFFADGGLLALGCNVFNLGFLPAFVGYPLYRLVAGDQPGTPRATLAAVLASLVSLQLGAFAVVLQTVASGISALPFGTFLSFMLPIHFAIGIVEGAVTATVVSFVLAARPGMLRRTAHTSRHAGRRFQPAFLAVALALGAVGTWFASTKPDGLEWSVVKITGASERVTPQAGLPAALSRLQQQTAVLPGYEVGSDAAGAARENRERDPAAPGDGSERLGRSLAGVLGGSITLVLALLVGFALKLRSARR